MACRHGIPSKNLDAVKFTCYSSEEIRKVSVKHITNPNSLDILLNPTKNGLYDPVLGPPTRLENCATCGLGSVQCPGHMGHIDLPLPVYQPAFFKILFCLLRGSCLKCHKLVVQRSRLLLMLYKLRALNQGEFQAVNKLQEAYSTVIAEASVDGGKGMNDDIIDDRLRQQYVDAVAGKVKACDEPTGDEISFSKNATEIRNNLVKEFVKLMSVKVTRCESCGATRPSLRSEQNSKIFVVESKDITKETTQYYLTPLMVRNHMCELWKNESSIIQNVFGAFHDVTMDDKLPADSEEDDAPTKRTSAIDVLFVTVLPVPPSRYRPVMVVNGKQYENPQTSIYSKVILDCILLRTLMSSLGEDDLIGEAEQMELDNSGKTTMWKNPTGDVKLSDRSMDMLKAIPGNTKGEKLENCWEHLQQHVNSIFDSEMNRSSLAAASTDICPGIKQKLEKKGGLFRKHMMGKRVNYAARSVISPDPYIATHEIGVPLCFASKLTYPTPVTPWNLNKLKQAVINGPNIYPGATMVVQEDGSTVLLKADNPNQRKDIAKRLNARRQYKKSQKEGLMGMKSVLRHMQNGDVMLVNRQPTLHKGSIMAHKVRVLPGEKTLRLHYANCKSYNADFDGDEMNAHFPQSELCRAEAFGLMSTNTQYLSMKDGKPLSGLIQDHMVAGVNMSVRGRYFTREQYQQLSYNALMHIPRKIKLLPPSILKPQVLWTGKQIFSTILINITPPGSPFLYLEGKSKIKGSDWESGVNRASYMKPREMCESEVIIRGSHLLCGVLDKNHYGPTEYGLVHSLYEVYGCAISGDLLTCLARLFTAFLQQYRGFTLGVEDILVTKPADSGRRKVISKTRKNGREDVASVVGVKDPSDVAEIVSRVHDAHVSKITGGEDGLAAVDHAMKRASNDVNDRIAKLCTGQGLNKTFPHNNLQLMVLSGAKGGAVNCMQISCLLGQIELEGRRPPLMVSGRSVPSFLPYDLSLRAGGFISQRFLTGIRPQEYFYHCMAGREGLVDTAVKTSRSGYLQRCLIKHLEGLVLSYDLTVRESDGSIVQFLYGEDGLDIGKQSYLNLDQHKFLTRNFEAESKLLPTLEQLDNTNVDSSRAEKAWRKFHRREKRQRKMEKRLRKERGDGIDWRRSPFLELSWENKSAEKSKVISAWREISPESRAEMTEKLQVHKIMDPICSELRPDLYYGSMSETFRHNMDEYLKDNPDKLPTKEKKRNKLPTLDRIKTMLSLKYQKSLCQPGESVGLIAAQSIGEPSTQMTLNTFHFAGRGEMNVTLGIPRLREILMVAAKQISTPQVIVPIYPGMERRAQKLQKQLTCVKLSQVLRKVNIRERLDVDARTAGHRSRKCKITLEILPEKQFKKDLALTRKKVLNFIEKEFLQTLLLAINHQFKLRQDEELVFSQKRANDSGIKEQEEGNAEEELQPSEEVVEKGEDEDEREEEIFDEDDAKRGKNKEDFEEEEGDDDGDDIQEEDKAENEGEGDEGKDDQGSRPYQEVSSIVRINKVKTMSAGQVHIVDYEFDESDDGWCKVVIDIPLKTAQVNIVSLVEIEAKRSYVQKVKGITRCVIQTNQKDPEQKNLATEGINFYKLFEFPDILDLNRLQCNCVHSMETTYGIEAAVRVIEREVTNVFAVYGIQVNRRHLSLVADYMCFLGKYSAFNRMGIESCSSAIQQMTFETTVKFLKDAALTGQWDSLQSPSARIVAGQVVKGGTGNFAVISPMTIK